MCFMCLPSLTTECCNTSDLYFCSLVFITAASFFLYENPPPPIIPISHGGVCCRWVGMLLFFTPGHAQAFWGHRRRAVLILTQEESVCLKRHNCLLLLWKPEVLRYSCHGRQGCVCPPVALKELRFSHRASWSKLAEWQTHCRKFMLLNQDGLIVFDVLCLKTFRRRQKAHSILGNNEGFC